MCFMNLDEPLLYIPRAVSVYHRSHFISMSICFHKSDSYGPRNIPYEGSYAPGTSSFVYTLIHRKGRLLSHTFLLSLYHKFTTHFVISAKKFGKACMSTRIRQSVCERKWVDFGIKRACVHGCVAVWRQ